MKNIKKLGMLFLVNCLFNNVLAINKGRRKKVSLQKLDQKKMDTYQDMVQDTQDQVNFATSDTSSDTHDMQVGSVDVSVKDVINNYYKDAFHDVMNDPDDYLTTNQLLSVVGGVAVLGSGLLGLVYYFSDPEEIKQAKKIEAKIKDSKKRAEVAKIRAEVQKIAKKMQKIDENFKQKIADELKKYDKSNNTKLFDLYTIKNKVELEFHKALESEIIKLSTKGLTDVNEFQRELQSIKQKEEAIFINNLTNNFKARGLSVQDYQKNTPQINLLTEKYFKENQNEENDKLIVTQKKLTEELIKTSQKYEKKLHTGLYQQATEEEDKKQSNEHLELEEIK